MINPLAPCYEWFLAFVGILPAPVSYFAMYVLVVFIITIVVGWFS